ncbi:MAG: DUF6794 domain-containing protein [bacterium]
MKIFSKSRGEKSKPKTLDDATDYVLSKLTVDQINEIKSNPHQDFHFSLGLYIRNNLGLVDMSNSSLIKDIGKRGFLTHPDTVSNVIVDEVVKKVLE